MNINLTARGKITLSLILIVIILVGCAVYRDLHQVQPVTGESQVQAETLVGVSLAAQNAGITVDAGQATEISRTITDIVKNNISPVSTIITTPAKVQSVAAQEVKTSGANFSIVTDPVNPTKQVDLMAVAKLPADTPVTLNQYNILAYKKIIRDITVYPSFNEITPNGVNEVDYGISRKISNDGKYIGVSTAYDFDSKKVKVGLKVTF